GGAWALVASGWTVSRVQASLRGLTKSPNGPESPREALAASTRPAWDGTVTLDETQRRAIGLSTAIVKRQDEPTTLERIATTEYDPNALTIIRPPLDLRVDKVFKVTGDQVKAGEPLLDIYSAALAAAKTAMEKEYSEWQHDLRLLESRKELYERGSITKQT